MPEGIRKAFEETLKFNQCQEVEPEDFCSQYILEDDNCGGCPYFIEETQGIEAQEKVLDFVLKLFKEGKLDNFID